MSPYASPIARVPSWTATRDAGGFKCEWGVLKVALFKEALGWSISFYLSKDVHIGLANETHRLCTTQTLGTLNEVAAKQWALNEANEWLSCENVNRLRALKSVHMPTWQDPHLPLLSYNPQGNG